MTSREVELGCESWTSLLQVVTQQRCNGLSPARQLKQQLRSTLVAAQWRGNTVLILTLPLFWRRSTASSASSVFQVGARGRAFNLSPPPPPHSPPPQSPSLISILAYVNVKQNVYLLSWHSIYSFPGEVDTVSRFDLAVSRGTSVRIRFGSPFSSKVVVCGHCLVNLSLTINETLKWLSSLPILMQESLW